MDYECTADNKILMVWSEDNYHAFDQPDAEEALFNIFSMAIKETSDNESTIDIFYC